jgi:hypothetical protein
MRNLKKSLGIVIIQQKFTLIILDTLFVVVMVVVMVTVGDGDAEISNYLTVEMFLLSHLIFSY